MSGTTVLDQLAALQVQAEAVAAAQDSSAAQALLQRVLAIDLGDAGTVTRALGQALHRMAATLSALVPPASTETLLQHAGWVFQRAPDSVFDDLIITLHNLALVYQQLGDAEQRRAMLTTILQLAQGHDGTMGADCMEILQNLSKIYQDAGLAAPMLVLEGCLRRFVLREPGVGDHTRAHWLGEHLDRLRAAGPEARIDQVLTQTLEILEARGDAPLTVARCCSELAHEAGLRQDWEAAARLLDRCRATPGLPPAEITLVLSLAARAWFKAGGFDAASQRSLAAVRRRARPTP